MAGSGTERSGREVVKFCTHDQNNIIYPYVILIITIYIVICIVHVTVYMYK